MQSSLYHKTVEYWYKNMIKMTYLHRILKRYFTEEFILLYEIRHTKVCLKSRLRKH